ncbi:MAG: hypothetical protein K0R50_268 [Eubacterium sp.]|nr:hypothetical protein [Eubacterium sp.]
MGMESFFVTLLPENMEFCFQDNIRRVCGNSNLFEMDWEAVLSNRNFSINKKESYLILDDCIEMEIEKNKEGSSYIVLRGCFSCFSESIEKMCCLIDYISNLVNKEVRVDVLGESARWENSDVSRTIFDSYIEKNNSFKRSFGDINLLVPPSRFYKEYEKIKNPIKRLLAKIFK